MNNTKPAFKCIAIHDYQRSAGVISANGVYPVTEYISDDYMIVIGDDGRGFPITPGNGRFVNAGEPFVEFVKVDLPAEEEAQMTTEAGNE